jgi:hypothetical protein
MALLSRPFRLASLVLALGLPAVTACGGNKESIVTIGGDKKLSAEEIDKDPLALLPSGAVGVVQADMQAFFASSMGPQALRIANNLVPLTAEMGFSPQRDLKTIVAGIYSMQGADVALVAQGSFDQAAITAAADKGAVTALGQPLKKLEYAGNSLYVSGDVGFVLLTSKTALAGNSVGIRRALDRIRDGRVKREVPDWMVDFLKTPNAQLIVVGDTSTQPIAAAAVQQAPFLQGIKTVRLLGNFQPPGMNLAGSLSYPDGTRAAQSEAQLKQLHEMAQAMSWLSFLGLSNPVQSMQTRVQESDVQVLAAIDGQSLGRLLDTLGTVTAFGAKPASTPPAASTTAPAPSGAR